MRCLLIAGTLLVSTLLLIGCVSSPTDPIPKYPTTGQPSPDIIQLTHTDLQNAAAISKMFNDMDHGVECYTWMDTNLTAVQQLFGANAPTNVSGIFSALESVNVGVNIAQGNSPQLLTLRYQAESACGPYVMNLAGGIAFLAGKAQGLATSVAPLMIKQTTPK